MSNSWRSIYCIEDTDVYSIKALWFRPGIYKEVTGMAIYLLAYYRGLRFYSYSWLTTLQPIPVSLVPLKELSLMTWPVVCRFYHQSRPAFRVLTLNPSVCRGIGRSPSRQGNNQGRCLRRGYHRFREDHLQSGEFSDSDYRSSWWSRWRPACIH